MSRISATFSVFVDFRTRCDYLRPLIIIMIKNFILYKSGNVQGKNMFKSTNLS